MKKFLSAISIFSLIFACPVPAFATDYTWTGLGGNSDVLTAGNWSPSGGPTVASDTIEFGTGGALADLKNNSGYQVAHVTFNRASDFEITATGSGVLGIGNLGAGDGITAQTPDANNRIYTISAPVKLDSDGQVWTVSNLGVNTTNLVVSGIISESGGAKSLTKVGNGTLTLEGINTYTGGTTVNEGTLSLTGSNNGGASVIGTGTLTINSGALVSTSGQDNPFGFNASIMHNIVINGGTLSAGTDWTTVDNITLTGGGRISGTGYLYMDYLSGQGYTDTITANGTGNVLSMGELYLHAATTISTADGASLTISAPITGGAGLGLTKTGAGTLTLSGLNTYTGTTTILAGKLIDSGFISDSSNLTVNGSSAIFDLGNNHSDTVGTVTLQGGGQITGTGTSVLSTTGTFEMQNGSVSAILAGASALNKTGPGTLTLSGANSYSGATLISAGTVVVGNNSALGTGAGGVTNNGTLNIGSFTLNLGGTYNQGAASTLVVAINGTSNGSIISTGTTTALSGYGLTLNVSNFVPNNTTYTIMTGAGGGAVATPLISVTGDNHVTFTTTAIGDKLILTSSRASNGFASDATNSNGSNAGTVLDGIPNPTGDMATVLNALSGLNNSQVGSALNTMTPDVSSGTMQASQQVISQFLGSVSTRLGYARNGMIGLATGDMIQGVGFWMQGLGSNLSQGERSGIQGFSSNTFGTSIGADKLINSHIRVGLAGGYGFANVNSKMPGSPSDSIDSYQGTVYGSYDSINLKEQPTNQKGSEGGFRNRSENSWYSDWMLGFTQSNFDSRREIWLMPSTMRAAKADHYGQQYATKLETGYTFVTELTKKLETTPFASLQYSYLRMNQYKEDGAGALDLSVNGNGYNQLLQTLGTKFAYPFVTKKVGTFIPAVKAAWLYDYIGDQFVTNASFAGGGSSFTTKGAKPAQNGLLIGGEIAFLNKGNMTLTANYDLELKDQFVGNTYYATARFDF